MSKLGSLFRRNKKSNEETKICRSCGRKLPIEEFHKQESQKDKYRSDCKECYERRAKVYKITNNLIKKFGIGNKTSEDGKIIISPFTKKEQRTLVHITCAWRNLQKTEKKKDILSCYQPLSWIPNEILLKELFYRFSNSDKLLPHDQYIPSVEEPKLSYEK